MTEQPDNVLRIRKSYISIDFFRRFLTSLCVGSISYFLFMIAFSFLVPYFGVGSVLIFAFIPSFVIGILPILSQRILKMKTDDWDYYDYLNLEVKATIVYATLIGVLIPYLLIYYWSLSTSGWSSYMLIFGLIALSLVIITLVLTSFKNFYTTSARVTLQLTDFLESHTGNIDTADFSILLGASRDTSRLAEKSNMTIDPYKLCLGLSIGCIQNEEETKKDLYDLSIWAQKPRNNDSFTKFRQSVLKYTNLALDASDCGITEKNHWSFERKSVLLGVLIVPLAVSLIAVLLPKLIEIFFS